MPKQRNKSDCVIAAVATATGRSYAEIRRTCAGSIKGGLETHEVSWLLSHFGNWRPIRLRKPIKAKEWAAKNPDARAVLIVDTAIWDDATHAVAVVSGKVTDPADGSEDHPGNVLMAYKFTPE